MFYHPRSVCMTYFEHFRLSMGFSLKFTLAAYQAFIHAIMPDIYITSTSDVLSDIQHILEKSGCRKNK